MSIYRIYIGRDDADKADDGAQVEIQAQVWAKARAVRVLQVEVGPAAASAEAAQLSGAANADTYMAGVQIVSDSIHAHEIIRQACFVVLFAL